MTINEAGEHMYQNVTLAGFDDAKNRVAQQKNTLSNEIHECITNRLEEENDSKSIFKLVLQILNTEIWIRTDESGETNLKLADNTVTVLLEHFATPLQNAGLTTQAAKLLNQWHNLLEYLHKYLLVTTTPYLICCHCIFTSPRCTTWKDILLLIKLLFTIPTSKVKLERMFSKLKQVKILHHSSVVKSIGKPSPNFRRWS